MAYKMNYKECEACKSYQCSTCGIEMNAGEQRAEEKKGKKMWTSNLRFIVVSTIIIGCMNGCITYIWEQNLVGWLLVGSSLLFGYLAIINYEYGQHEGNKMWRVGLVGLYVVIIFRVGNIIYQNLDVIKLFINTYVERLLYELLHWGPR